MKAPEIAQFGSWRSPITSAAIATGGVRLGQVQLDRGEVYWVEGRPAEAGRNVIVHTRADGTSEDVTPVPFNVRTRVHEYGGGAYAVQDGTVFFCNDADQRVYRQDQGLAPQAITPQAKARYADLICDRLRRRLIAVREDASGDGEPAASLVAIDMEGTGVRVLSQGADFYASPCLCADGKQLAWLSWNHPNMPWDGSELWIAALSEDGALEPPRRVAGGEQESIFQPQYSPDGTLYFVSDASGWWNLYRAGEGSTDNICPMHAEFGLPQWIFGLSSYAFVDDRRALCAYVEKGASKLALLDLRSRRLSPLNTPFSDIGYVRADGETGYFHAGAPDRQDAIVKFDLSAQVYNLVSQPAPLPCDSAYFSAARPLELQNQRGQSVHAFYYAPTHPEYRAPMEEKPPLIVVSHGGPTAASGSALKLGLQFWTSRGFAVLDVNYGGSTGFGREYRQRLNGEWGIADVADCVAGAKYLAARGLVDPDRLIIRGSSAGGYTTLCALTFHDCFKAGASYYGVSDLTALAHDTHKFESRYLDRLIGPYPACKDLYHARSPIHFADRLSAPVIFLQGLEDKVVPPNQAEQMVAALRKKRLTVAFIAFEGEQHGFRKATTLTRALEAELYFYSKVFNFALPDPIEPIAIENL